MDIVFADLPDVDLLRPTVLDKFFQEPQFSIQSGCRRLGQPVIVTLQESWPRRNRAQEDTQRATRPQLRDHVYYKREEDIVQPVVAADDLGCLQVSFITDCRLHP